MEVVPGDTTRGSKEDKEGTIPQHVLAAPGLPTVSKKLAQRIWALEIIEMNEFLPTNKVVQSLESGDGTPGSSETHSKSKRVADIITWVRCFFVSSSNCTEESKHSGTNGVPTTILLHGYQNYRGSV